MIGDTISHYKIIEKLGEGGMGVVYRALDMRLDREVAIKFLPAHLSSDPEATRRFIHEAKAASAIDHSHIGTIHEIDRTDDGATFIVMALYDGETLRARMGRRRLGVGDALNIAAQIASGLSKAHQKGIVHRDLKPSNIIITSDGEVKIIDFGLAKLAGRTRLTKEASTLGTAAYMSPEQARGEEVDHRSDIFSLGVILFEMLAGEPPFKGEHEAALLYEIVHESAARLSTYRDDIQEDLQLIVDRSLEKAAADRYQNAEDLLNALSVLLREIDSSRAGVPRGADVVAGRAGRTWRRPVALVLPIVILAGIAIVLMRNFLPVATKKDFAIAVVDFRDLGNPDDPTQSAGLSGLLHVGLVESSPCRVISPELLYDLRRRLFGSESGPIKEDQSLELARKSGAAVFLSGHMLLSGTRPYIIWKLVESKNGRSIEARRIEGGDLSMLTDRIIADILPLLGRECGVEEQKTPPPVSSMTTDSPEAYRHYVAGLLAADNKDIEKAQPEFERAVALDSSFALAYYQLSKIHFYILGGGGQKEKARALAERAWKHKANLGTKDRLRLEAWREQINDRIQDALDICREMLLRWPDDLEILDELGRRYTYYWYFEEGLKIARQGLAYYPDDYNLVYRAAAFLGFLGRRREALELARSYAERHEEEARAWAGVAMRYLDLAVPDSAETAARRAIEIDPDAFYAHGVIADCYYYRGDLEGAIEANRRILDRDDLAQGRRIMILANIAYWPQLPLLYMEGGRFERALEMFAEARKFISDPNDEALIERNLDRVLLRRGMAEEVLRRTQDVQDLASGDQKTGMREYLRIRALIALDSLEVARAAFSELAAREHPFGLAHLYPQDKIRVELALAEKDSETALEILEGMQRRGMPYSAGLWYIEWREALAEAYRIAGRLDEAAEVHEKMLEEFRGHYISHYKLGRIHEEMGHRPEAVNEYERFLEKWKNADEGLPQLEDARSRLAALKGA